MSIKHTPEPWTNNCSAFIETESGIKIAQTFNRRDENFENVHANAARIVACVNACAGMGDPESTIKGMRYELDRFRTGISDAENREIAELKVQLDELLIIQNRQKETIEQLIESEETHKKAFAQTDDKAGRYLREIVDLKEQRNELLEVLKRAQFVMNKARSRLFNIDHLMGTIATVLDKHGYDLITDNPHETPPQS